MTITRVEPSRLYEVFDPTALGSGLMREGNPLQQGSIIKTSQDGSSFQIVAQPGGKAPALSHQKYNFNGMARTKGPDTLGLQAPKQEQVQEIPNYRTMVSPGQEYRT